MSDATSSAGCWFWVTAIGQDRPGIVAELARAVTEAGGNIEDASMSRFRAWFAAMLLVSGPSEFAEGVALPGGDGLHSSVQPVGAAPAGDAPRPGQRLSVYGADRPGIVAAVGEALREAGANVLSLEVDVVRERVEAPLFVMSLDLEAGTALSAGFAQSLGEQLGLEVHLVELDAPML